MIRTNILIIFFFFNDTATTEIYTLSLHDALPIYLAQLSERWGYRVVRGSSKRGGDVGLLGLVRHLRQGGEVALTPDAPRGPAERMKPGALAAAQHANALVIATGARTSSAWWLRSWDRFCLPRPFARVDVVDSAPFGLE